MSERSHYSVLLDESVSALVTDPSGLYVDGTFGRGGHSRAILARLSLQGAVLGFDKDPAAIAVAGALAQSDARFSAVHQSFTAIAAELAQRQVQADGVLLDLGVSSPQLDDAERGFSFLRDGPLDMRMDNSRGISAAEWLAKTDERDMAYVFKRYGEERFAKRIARRIVEARLEQNIERTAQLAEIVSDAMPFKEEGKHPATRVFQAIRIEINNELGDLEAALKSSLALLKPGGRMVVISFHSLEDRLVKRFFRRFSQSQDYPLGVPVTHDKLKAPLAIIGKAVKASEAELKENIRSRSAVMRVAERNK